MNIVGITPARMAFSRFPGKPYMLKNPVFIFLSVVVAFFLFMGYQYDFGRVTEDNAFYFFDVYKWVDPGLFPNDHMSLQSQGRVTILLMVYGTLMKAGISAGTLLLIAFLTTLSIVFMCVFNFFRDETQDDIAAYATAGILTFLVFPIIKALGTNVSMADFFAHPHFIALALVLSAVWAAYREKYFVSTILQAAAFLVHPLQGFAVTVGYFAFVFFFKRKEQKFWMHVSLFLIMVSPVIFLYLSGVRDHFTILKVMPGEYAETMQIRGRFFFPELWRGQAFIELVLLPIAAVLLLRTSALSRMNQKRQLFYSIGFAVLIISVISIITAVTYKSVFLIRIQQQRAFVFIYFFTVIWGLIYLYKRILNKDLFTYLLLLLSITIIARKLYQLVGLPLLGHTLYLRYSWIPLFALLLGVLWLLRKRLTAWQRNIWYKRASIILVCLLVFKLLLSSARCWKDRFVEQGLRQPYYGLTQWVRENTDKGGGFLIDPRLPNFRADSDFFRMDSLRTPFYDYKDIGLSVFNYNYGKEIVRRYKAVMENTDRFATPEFVRDFCAANGVTYFVTNGDYPVFSEVYDNGTYKLYRVK